MVQNPIENPTFWQAKMNQLGRAGIPFLFILDFELKAPFVVALDGLDDDILYKINDFRNYKNEKLPEKQLHFTSKPIDFDHYEKAFNEVQKEIHFGNSFLLNLTFPTQVESNFNLKEIFDIAQARYKLYYKGEFIVFSPETFVKIIDGKIYTFPMKGTIDADIPNAENIIINDQKEAAEHYTITDLLRNDLSIVATQVNVNRFRYIEKLKTNIKNLLQVSSEIVGTLPEDYASQLGDIFGKLLPAGSISGAPKNKTVEIIKANEKDDRGYYTGVFGVFDGKNVDSAVMIRYIEQNASGLLYRSGCGITFQSDCVAEYQEMIDKVYVPIH